MKLMSLFIASLLFAPHNIIIEKWVIERNSNLSIEGKSNVNSFRCDVTEYLQPDTVWFYKEDQQQQFNIKGGLTITVNGIDCHQRYMTNDLRKALKADKYPSLKIDLLSISDFTNANKNITGIVDISLSGIRRKMYVNYIVQTGTDGTLHLFGSRQVLFSDFGLTPPEKLAGLIKVEEQLSIRFHLILRAL